MFLCLSAVAIVFLLCDISSSLQWERMYCKSISDSCRQMLKDMEEIKKKLS